jgi:hypothetical protein
MILLLLSHMNASIAAQSKRKEQPDATFNTFIFDELQVTPESAD